MFDFQIGGNAVDPDASEGMANIALNRSLFAQKLTDEDPIKPEAVYDLKTVDEVFEHYKPKVKVEFDHEDGSSAEEEIRFKNVADFKSSSIVNQSPFLQSMNNQKDAYQKIIKQLKTNKVVSRVMDDADTKAAFVNALQALIKELEG